MRLIKDKAGSFLEDQQLQSSAAKLAFSVASATGFTETIFDAMKIQLNVVTAANGQRPLCPKMPFRALLNMSAKREGFFTLGTTSITGCVDLSVVGAVHLSDGDYIQINYEGFPSDALTTIYAVDHASKTNFFTTVEDVVINGTSKDMNVVNKSELWFPVKDGNGNGIDTIKLLYAGANVDYREEEIRIANCSENDLVYVASQAFVSTTAAATGLNLQRYGYDKWLVVNITDVVALKITPLTNSPVTIYTVQHVAIG